MSDQYRALAEALIDGDIEGVADLTRKALTAGTEAQMVLEKGLLAGMEVVGRRFKVGDMFVPEVLLAAKCMNAAMEILRPLLAEGQMEETGTVVIGTVEGDIHNIGKNLVAMLLEGAGFKVVDLGIDIKPQEFLEASVKHKPDIVAMSALLTTTMPKMRETIALLEESGIRDKVKVMAGGAPVTQDFVLEIGGDAYAPNAVAAAEMAKSLLRR